MTIKEYVRNIASKLFNFVCPPLPIAIPLPIRQHADVDRHSSLFD